MRIIETASFRTSASWRFDFTAAPARTVRRRQQRRIWQRHPSGRRRPARSHGRETIRPRWRSADGQEKPDRLAGRPNERRLFAQILAVLGAPLNPRATIVELERTTVRLLDDLGVQVLVLTRSIMFSRRPGATSASFSIRCAI
ncbi:hypothetical protein FEV16_14260 [Methylocystis sp. B8]|nr:hypothetical protein FEV16_14260 [Methylocystis sp. B8]